MGANETDAFEESAFAKSVDAEIIALQREGTDFLDIVCADGIETDDEEFDDELIERILNRDGMSVMYGDSNCGKTFLAIEMACCIALGKQFLGRETEQGAVLYLATEGYASVMKRLKAYKKHHGVAHLPVFVVKTPINFFDSTAHADLIIKHGVTIEAETGLKVKNVFSDTLARTAAGANENSGQDMAIVLDSADSVRRNLKTHFTWIHHCGKDAARGLRGWSGIRAAIDTEIEVAEDVSGVRSVEITKQRDGDGKGDRYGFNLHPVCIGYNKRGEERSTCVVQLDFAPAKATKGREFKNENLMNKAFILCNERHGEITKEGTREFFYELRIGEQDAKRQAFNREWDKAMTSISKHPVLSKCHVNHTVTT